MISLMYDMFDDIIAAKIITCLEHPTAKRKKHHVAFKDVLKFDTIDQSEPKTLYGFAHIGNHDRHYLTYGGGPEGGMVKTYGDGWCVWHRDWGTRATYTKIPEELEIVYKNDDGHGAIKMVLCKHGYDDYELGEDENYLDDLERDMDWRQN